jgi:hypothetical protein
VEHAAVTTYAGEGGIVLRNGDVEDFIAVGGVGLDELGCAGWIEEVAAG